MKNVRRLALVLHYLPPHEGGIERVVARLAEEYTALGVEVVVIGWRPLLMPDPERFWAIDADVPIVALRAWNGLERHGVPAPLIEPVSSWARMAQVMRRVDAVHAHGLAYPTCAMALCQARRLGLPAISTEHVGPIPYDHPLWRLLQGAVFSVAGRAARRSIRALTVLNDRVGAEMTGLVRPVPVVKVPNGVDTVRFAPPTASQRAEARRRFALTRPTVISVGRNVAKKGFRHVVAAANTEGPSPTDDPAFDVVLVGVGTSVLRRPHVRAIEHLAQSDLAVLYQGADLMVLASEGEGLPLVVQEALASGLPVIMGNDPAVRAELPDGPVTFVRPDHAATLRTAVLDLLGDDERLERLRREARREAISRFDWSVSAQRYLELLGLGRGDGPPRRSVLAFPA